MKCIEDLDIRPKAIKLLDGNTGGKLLDIDFGKDILDLISTAILTLTLTDSSRETILAFSLLLPFPLLGKFFPLFFTYLALISSLVLF